MDDISTRILNEHAFLSLTGESRLIVRFWPRSQPLRNSIPAFDKNIVETGIRGREAGVERRAAGVVGFLRNDSFRVNPCDIQAYERSN